MLAILEFLSLTMYCLLFIIVTIQVQLKSNSKEIHTSPCTEHICHFKSSANKHGMTY